MFDPQYLWFFLTLVGFGAFAQGFTGIGFGIIILAGMGFTPWDFERTTVALTPARGKAVSIRFHTTATGDAAVT